MLKAIIFDMDGVLIDSINGWYAIFNKALEHFEGKTVSKEEFGKNAWGKNFNEVTDKYFSVSVDRIKEYYADSHQLFMDNLVIFNDAKDTLEQLKKNLKLAVATNTPTEQARKILKSVNILELFDYVLGGDKVENGKPSPDIILKILKDMRLKRDEVIFIGDTIWDKKAAEKAGVRFIGFKLDSEEKIEALSEILDIIR
ncbi:MAG: HAD family hydrolase [Nanoarchaeota archaeon]|nr:HAD family hydrolase [Nanoarchaeota archaeon]